MAEESQNSLPRLKLGEYGVVGLNQISGIILEESKQELRFPEVNCTYKKMRNNSVIASAMSLYEMMVSRVKWTVVPPANATEEEKRQTEIVSQMVNDMEHSWFSFIKEVTSCFTYGYCVNEKVWRKRLKRNGSRYNDGYIGWKKLPVRSQDTLVEWKFSDDGRELLGVKQDPRRASADGRYIVLETMDSGLIGIPRQKFLLFRTDVQRENPMGNSPLKNVYYSWKYMTTLQASEAMGIARDIQGIPVIYLPPDYMSEDAPQEKKNIYEYYKKVVRNIQQNEQAGLILPNFYNDRGDRLFEFDLLATKGSKMYDTSAVITRYANEILTALFADVLKLGVDSHGSFSLAESKTSIMAMAIEHRLLEIRDVLNNDLVRETYERNEWDASRTCTFEFEDLDEPSLAEFAKAIQQIAATNMIEFDREVANVVRKRVGVSEKPADEPVDRELLPNNRSRSGDGLATGMGNGTSTSVSIDDNEAANLSS